MRFSGIRPPSLTTQFVVGAASEKDADIIKATHSLYKNFSMSRVFYSAFRPVCGTPLEERPAESLTREHRLYQADFLMRFYRFKPYDIPVKEDGSLENDVDPKMAWAKQHPEFFPINLNSADYWTLIKVPGLGPESAKKIIKLRKQSRLKSLDQLEGQRIQINKAIEFACC